MTTHADEAGPFGATSSKSYLKDYSRVGPNKSMEASRESHTK